MGRGRAARIEWTREVFMNKVTLGRSGKGLSERVLRGYPGGNDQVSVMRAKALRKGLVWRARRGADGAVSVARSSRQEAAGSGSQGSQRPHHIGPHREYKPWCEGWSAPQFPYFMQLWYYGT